MSRRMWGKYVPVSTRRAKAKKTTEKLKKNGQTIEPVEIEGRLIAKKFWGKKWCEHLESFADYENRLPRGRTYARNGSITHLGIQTGQIEALVSGSSLYRVSVTIKTLCSSNWELIKKRCSNQIGSILEILQGKLSDSVMGVVADHKEGLFPDTTEMEFNCSCPDWATMCKHVAAVLYGVGNRLDSRPDLLFVLRGVDPSELVTAQLHVDMATTTDQLENGQLADIFGIDLEDEPVSPILSAKKEENVKKTNLPPKKLLDLDNFTGDDLLKYRTKMGFSAAEFAKALGVTPASIYRWENCPDVIKMHARSKNTLSRLLQES